MPRRRPVRVAALLLGLGVVSSIGLGATGVPEILRVRRFERLTGHADVPFDHMDAERFGEVETLLGQLFAERGIVPRHAALRGYPQAPGVVAAFPDAPGGARWVVVSRSSSGTSILLLDARGRELDVAVRNGAPLELIAGRAQDGQPVVVAALRYLGEQCGERVEFEGWSVIGIDADGLRVEALADANACLEHGRPLISSPDAVGGAPPRRALEARPTDDPIDCTLRWHDWALPLSEGWNDLDLSDQPGICWQARD